MARSTGRVTLEDVAAEAGVSRGSVSNVIRNQPHVREEVRDRVNAAIAKLGYRPNAIGQSLVSGRTGPSAPRSPTTATSSDPGDSNANPSTTPTAGTR